MKKLSSYLRVINKVVLYLENAFADRSKTKLYIDSSLPDPVLQDVRMLRVSRGWKWRGEYHIYPKEPGKVEVILYSLEGKIRIVQINADGELKFIYPKDAIRFCVY